MVDPVNLIDLTNPFVYIMGFRCTSLYFVRNSCMRIHSKYGDCLHTHEALYIRSETTRTEINIKVMNSPGTFESPILSGTKKL